MAPQLRDIVKVCLHDLSDVQQIDSTFQLDRLGLGMFRVN